MDREEILEDLGGKETFVEYCASLGPLAARKTLLPEMLAECPAERGQRLRWYGGVAKTRECKVESATRKEGRRQGERSACAHLLDSLDFISLPLKREMASRACMRACKCWVAWGQAREMDHGRITVNVNVERDGGGGQQKKAQQVRRR